MWNPNNTTKVSETRDMVFLNRMFFRTPTLPVHKKQGTDDEDLDSVQQDERGGGDPQFPWMDRPSQI
jgi:hypothetical protein